MSLTLNVVGADIVGTSVDVVVPLYVPLSAEPPTTALL